MEVNKYQTPLTDEVLSQLSKEEYEQLFDYINNIPFIQSLISPDRKRARDLPRHNNKIIVDVCHPHILEDMEYFRPAGNYYKQHGCFTKLRPNGNPNSEFGKWFKTELNRIWNGYVRPSDGEWVTGDFYFYINYCPIMISRIKDNNKKVAYRVNDFPEIWEGNYLWFHYIDQARNGGLYNDFTGGQHAVLIARRGVGKSFSAGALLAKLFTCGENEETTREVTGLVTAYEKEYLTKDGILNKFVNMADFCAENTQFPSARYKNSLAEMDWIMGYQDVNTGILKGTKNEIIGFSSKDNPDKGRGKRAHKLIFEEFGRFPQFLNTWNTSIYNVKEGDFAFGQMIAFGTGGTTGSDFSGALELIYHPEGYGVYAIPNVFDKNSQGKSKSVFFLGAYMNRKGYYNKDGVSDVIGALISEIKERTQIKYNSSDVMALTQRKAEMAITIQEAIMKRDNTIYPVADLNDRLNEIDFNPHYFDDLWIGSLSLKDGNVVYTPNTEVEYIKNFPHKDNKLEGAICIKAMPEKDSSGRVPYGRYIAGIDPYDDDVSNTMSLGALYILDLFTDELVFEYVGRPTFADDFYEICRKALLFYNAECNYENNKKGLFKYFSQHNCLYLLSDTLDFLKDKELIRGNLYGNKAKGVNATESIKAYARRCIRDWLLKPIENIKELDNGEIEETTSLNLFKIPFRALIQELSTWNSDGNFDRHDALGMLMLLREDKLRLIGESNIEDTLKEDPNYLGNDPFFQSKKLLKFTY